jgi:hypothetical protein
MDDDDLFSGSGSRLARRRERRAQVRRRRIISLVVVLVAAAVVAGVVLATSWGSGAADGSSAGGSGAGQGGAPAPLAAASAVPSPSASPSPSPETSSTPAPPLEQPTTKHPYRVYFGGDSLAGLPGELFAQLGQQSGLMKVHTDYQVSSRLTNSAPVDWPAHLQAQLKAGHPDVGVFLIGINDPGMPMIAEGSFTMYPKKAWLQEYQRRADRLMKLMLRDGVKRVYWVGLPVMPDKGQTKQAGRLNELFKAAAARHPDVVYVDTFGLLTDKKGRFDASVRSGDGVHFTNEGAARIAGAVWKAMKKDWQTP